MTRGTSLLIFLGRHSLSRGSQYALQHLLADGILYLDTVYFVFLSVDRLSDLLQSGIVGKIIDGGFVQESSTLSNTAA